MKEILENFNDTEAQNSFDRADVEKNKILVAICYIFPILFFLPIVLNGTSKYCRFHANQQLTLLICNIVIGFVLGIFMLIPVLGWILDSLIGIAMLALVIMLAYGAYSGMAVRIPFVGDMLKVFD